MSWKTPLPTERLLPRMFHRRLALLGALALTVSMGLGVQLIKLTVIDGAERRANAERRLDRRSYPPPARGRILDRHGRVLAADVRAYDIAIDYEVITGKWQFDRAYVAARTTHAERWAEMSPEARLAAYERARPEFDAIAERLWREVYTATRETAEDIEARRERITEEVEYMAGRHWVRKREEEWLQFGAPDPEKDDPFKPEPIREQNIPHVILSDVSEEIAFQFRRLEGELPGIHVVDSRTRAYPWSNTTLAVTLDRSTLPRPLRSEEPLRVAVVGVADHIIGEVRDEVWEEDINRRPFFRVNESGETEIDLKGYRVGDAVGNRAAEFIYEDWLRGTRGVTEHHKNTGEEDVTPPINGNDLQLTIDIELQAEIQAILSPEFGLMQVHQYQAGWDKDGLPKPTQFPIGTPLNGAAVVLDVDSAEILACVSMPTNATADGWSKETLEAVRPYMNRAVESPYPPGSIIKPLVLAAAVGEGVHALDHRIDCTGHYFPNWKNMARCWIYREAYGYRTHNDVVGGPLDGRQALAQSCNCYFYTLAEQLGEERLVKWYSDFGVGRFLGVGLGYERMVRPEEGAAPELRVVGETAGDLLPGGSQATVFDVVSLGIGGGPISWTPIHAANAYAIIARHGYIRDPSIIKQGPASARPGRTGDLAIGPQTVQTILDGLYDSLHDRLGTGHHIRYQDLEEDPIINVDDVTVWAKTGTATEVVKNPRHDEHKSPEEPETIKLDHAWFVGLVGDGREQARPKYAVAVLVEYGGSGGRVAGPVANEIIRALKARGYLE